MQVSVRLHGQWRFERYRDLLASLREQGRSLASFVTPSELPPDLKGDGEALVVYVSPDLAKAVQEGLQAHEPGPQRDGMDRWSLRAAQNDPELDLSALTAWRPEGARRLGEAVRKILVTAVRELGSGPGGEDVAHSVGLGLVALLRRQCTTRSLAMAALAVFQSELDRLAEGPLGVNTSARLGLRWMMLAQPLALGVDAYELARSPVGFYGTDPLAMQWARRILTEPVEEVPLDRAFKLLSTRLRLTQDPVLRLAKAAFLERLRDGLLAAVDALSRSGPISEDSMPILEASRSFHRLVQDAFNARRRAALLRTLQRSRLPANLIGRLEEQLARAEDLAAGKRGVWFDDAELIKQAERIAQGALTLRLDEIVSQRTNDVRLLPGSVGQALFEGGSALGLGLAEGTPAYHFRVRDHQTVAWMELRVDKVALPAMESAFDAPARQVRNQLTAREGLAFDETGPHRWRLRGPAWAVLQWAVHMRNLADRASARLADPSPEAAARRPQLDARLQRLRLRASHAPSRALDDEIALLEQERRDLRDRVPLVAAIGIARSEFQYGRSDADRWARWAADGLEFAEDLAAGAEGPRAAWTQLGSVRRLANRGLVMHEQVLDGLRDETRWDVRRLRARPPESSGFPEEPTEFSVVPAQNLVFRSLEGGWWEWLAPQAPLHAWARRRARDPNSGPG